MKNIRLLSLEKIAALADSNRDRVENWIEKEEIQLTREKNGKLGVDPLQLYKFIDKK